MEVTDHVFKVQPIIMVLCLSLTTMGLHKYVYSRREKRDLRLNEIREYYMLIEGGI